MGRYAFLVGTGSYTGFDALSCPSRDVAELAAVLGDPERGGFDVTVAENWPTPELTEALEEFTNERSGDDELLVYFSCHGQLDARGRLHFVTTSTKPNRVGSTALAASLVDDFLQNSVATRKILLLDCCVSGSYRFPDLSGSGYLVIPASDDLHLAWESKDTETGLSVFTDVLLAGLADHTNATGGWITAANLAPYLQREVQRRTNGEQSPQLKTNGAPDLLLCRPPRADATDPAFDDWHAYGRGVLYRAKSGYYFTGRTRVLQRIVRWLNDSGESTPRVVTGDPGSGKTAVLARIATLADVRLRETYPSHVLENAPDGTVPEPGSITVAVHAKDRSTEDVARRIADALKLDGGTPTDVINGVINRGQPTVIVIDAVDEAADPDDLVLMLQQLALSGGEYGGRLLLGARRGALDALPGADVIDLDADDSLGDTDVRDYVVALLVSEQDPTSRTPYRGDPAGALPVAGEIARRAAGNFLIAQLLALSVMQGGDHSDLSRLPGDPSGALDEFLSQLACRLNTSRACPATAGATAGEITRWLRDLLTPLSIAEGTRLHDDAVWATMANATRPGLARFTVDDVRWLRASPLANLLRAVKTPSGTGWELFHQEVIDALAKRHRGSASLHERIADGLRDRLPRHPSGATDWRRADPYTRGFLAVHAKLGDRLDALLDDPEFLVHADPGPLRPLLAESGRATARLYAEASRNHRMADPGVRRKVLSLDAMRMGQRDLSARLANPPDAAPLTWQVRWTAEAHGLEVGTWDEFGVWRIACARLGLDPVVITTGSDGKARVWDANRGDLIHTLDGHTDTPYALACTVVDSVPVAVTGGGDLTMMLWDLARGSLEHTFDLHTQEIGKIVCMSHGNTPMAVSTSYDYDAAVWDLREKKLLHMLSGHTAPVDGVAVTTIDGMPVAVTTSHDETARVWDLTTGEPRHKLTGHLGPLTNVVCGEHLGVPIAVTGGYDDLAIVWDLTTGEPLHELDGHTGPVNHVAFTTLRGHPVVVTTSEDATARIWDLTIPRCRAVLTGFSDESNLIRFTRVAGRPAVITSSWDGTVRIWDLESGTELDSLPFPAPAVPIDMTPDGDLIVGFEGEIAALRPTDAERT